MKKHLLLVLAMTLIFTVGCNSTAPKTEEQEKFAPDEDSRNELIIVDTDLDGIADDIDNCPKVANSDQSDADKNGVGEACEPATCIAPEKTVSKPKTHLRLTADNLLDPAIFTKRFDPTNTKLHHWYDMWKTGYAAVCDIATPVPYLYIDYDKDGKKDDLCDPKTYGVDTLAKVDTETVRQVSTSQSSVMLGRVSAAELSSPSVGGSKFCQPTGRYSSIKSRTIPVETGKTYTFSTHVLADNSPTDVFLYYSFYSDKGWCENDPMGAHSILSSKNEWQELVRQMTIPKVCKNFPDVDVKYVTFLIEKTQCLGADSDVFVSEPYFGEGVGFSDTPPEKEAFNGGKTRIDALGNYQILKDGVFKDFFPICVYSNYFHIPALSIDNPNTAARLKDYVDHGINCIEFVDAFLTPSDTKKVIARLNSMGIMSGVYLVLYSFPVGWANLRDNETVPVDILDDIRNDTERTFQKKIRDLEEMIAAVADTEGLLSYAYDNELNLLYKRNIKVFDTLHRLDPDHPITMVQGVGAQLIAPYSGYVNSHENYVGGLSLNPAYFNLVDNYSPDKIPAGIGLIDPGVTQPESVKIRAYLNIMQGGKGLSLNTDPLYYPATEPRTWISSLPFWKNQESRGSEMKRVASEMQQLLPLIREPHWTEWKALASESTIPVSTRNHDGEGYIFSLNPTNKELDVEFTLKGLPYMPISAEGYFKDLPPETVTGSIEGGVKFTVTLPAMGRAVYRLVAPACVSK